jgi:hypothetical protein
MLPHDAGDALPVERSEVDVSGPGDPADLRERPARRVPPVEVVAADGEHEEQLPAAPARQGHGEVLGRATRPVHVLEHEHHGSDGSGLEHGQPEVLEHAEGLRAPRHLRVEEGAHPPGARAAVEVIQPGDQLAHGLDDGTERDAGVDVETVPQEHAAAEPLGTAGQVRDERGLADPGVPADEHGLGPAVQGEGQGVDELRALPLTAEESGAPALCWHRGHRLGMRVQVPRAVIVGAAGVTPPCTSGPAPGPFVHPSDEPRGGRGPALLTAGRRRPSVTLWCARGELNPHVLSDTRT